MLRKQILSTYANKFKVSEIDLLKISVIGKKARVHSSSRVPDIPIAKIPQHRVSLDKCQLDHFLEFTSRPYYYQNMAHRGRKFRLESGEELVIPNIVRTVARCTIVNQYLDFCKEENFSLMSCATL